MIVDYILTSDKVGFDHASVKSSNPIEYTLKSAKGFIKSSLEFSSLP